MEESFESRVRRVMLSTSLKPPAQLMNLNYQRKDCATVFLAVVGTFWGGLVVVRLTMRV